MFHLVDGDTRFQNFLIVRLIVWYLWASAFAFSIPQRPYDMHNVSSNGAGLSIVPSEFRRHFSFPIFQTLRVSTTLALGVDYGFAAYVSAAPKKIAARIF